MSVGRVKLSRFLPPLHPTADGVRMFAEPVRELEALRGKKHSWADLRGKKTGEENGTGLIIDGGRRCR
jgi:hypothetical protein